MKRSWAVAAVALAALFLSVSIRAEDAASSDGDAFKEKGLAKQGNLYVLASEAEVSSGMKELRALKAKVDEDTRQRRKYEAQVKTAKNAIAQLEFEHRRLNEQYLREQDPTIHNQIVAKMNIVTSQMNQAVEFKNTAEGKMHGAGEEARAKYVNQLIDLAAKSDEAQKKYEALASDEEIKGELEKVNQSAKIKMKLGPSAEFKQLYAAIKRLRGDVNSDVVNVQIENHVPTLEVTLNGKITRTMVLDSGCGTVAIPADLAKELELAPGPTDPTIRLQLADGKIIEGRQMTLKSVRVGTFTIENVECAVLPETLIAAQPLLGGSFLNNFTYRLDAEAGQLHLAQVGGTGPKTTEKTVSGDKPDLSKKPEKATSEK